MIDFLCKRIYNNSIIRKKNLIINIPFVKSCEYICIGVVILDKISKKEKLKGFTLLELMVVLLILGILAAMFIPTMVSYIKKATTSSASIYCRNAVQAAQVIATEKYASGEKAPKLTEYSAKELRLVEDLAELQKNTVTQAAYQNGKIMSLTYTDGEYSVSYSAASGKGIYSEPVALSESG